MKLSTCHKTDAKARSDTGLDTVLVRYLAQDQETGPRSAAKEIEGAAALQAEKLVTTPRSPLCELVWVLEKQGYRF